MLKLALGYSVAYFVIWTAVISAAIILLAVAHAEIETASLEAEPSVNIWCQVYLIQLILRSANDWTYVYASRSLQRYCLLWQPEAIWRELHGCGLEKAERCEDRGACFLVCVGVATISMGELSANASAIGILLAVPYGTELGDWNRLYQAY